MRFNYPKVSIVHFTLDSCYVIPIQSGPQEGSIEYSRYFNLRYFLQENDINVTFRCVYVNVIYLLRMRISKISFWTLRIHCSLVNLNFQNLQQLKPMSMLIGLKFLKRQRSAHLDLVVLAQLPWWCKFAPSCG